MRTTIQATLFAIVLAILSTPAFAQTYQSPVTITVSYVVSGESFSFDASDAARNGSGIVANVEAMAMPGARALQIDLRDTTGEDRAIDLDVTVPGDFAGWTWHRDIREATPITPAARLQESRYPLAVVTPDDGEGLALAIEPSQPLIYELRGDAEGLTLHGQLGLTPAGSGEFESRAHVRVYLFPVESEWGFRDALATYYDLFPEAFERRAMNEGSGCSHFRIPSCPTHRITPTTKGGRAAGSMTRSTGSGPTPTRKSPRRPSTCTACPPTARTRWPPSRSIAVIAN